MDYCNTWIIVTLGAGSASAERSPPLSAPLINHPPAASAHVSPLLRIRLCCSRTARIAGAASHTSHITRHTSRITRHTSRVTRHPGHRQQQQRPQHRLLPLCLASVGRMSHGTVTRPFTRIPQGPVAVCSPHVLIRNMSNLFVDVGGRR